MADEVTTDAQAPAAQADTSTSEAAAVTSPGAGSSTPDGAGAPSGTVLGGADAPPKDAAGANDASATAWNAQDLSIPEGATLQAADVERIAATARARGLSKDAAQAMVESAHEARTAYADAVQTEAKRQIAEWNAAWKQDPALGTTPEERQASVDKGLRVLRRYAEHAPEDAAAFAKYLNQTGEGSHPAAVRFFAWLGKAAGEGTLALPNGAPGGTRPQTLAEKLYGDSMNPKPAA